MIQFDAAAIRICDGEAILAALFALELQVAEMEKELHVITEQLRALEERA